MRWRVQFLALLSGLRIQHCCELWKWSQMRLGSHVAVAGAGSCGSNSIPSLEPPYALKSKKKKKKKEKRTELDVRRTGAVPGARWIRGPITCWDRTQIWRPQGAACLHHAPLAGLEDTLRSLHLTHSFYGRENRSP